MTITIYGIKNCDTMKKARDWLAAHHVDVAFHDYKASGIDEAHLKAWAGKVGWEVLLNRSGTTFKGLPEDKKQELDEAKAIALMLEQPSMIKRPVLDLGGRLLVGFKPEAYAAAFASRNRHMQQRELGKAGPMTSAIGLGCMGMSGMYGPSDRTESIATIHAALDAGVTLIDTGDFYGMGHNEMLIGEALRGVRRDRYRLSVKFGAQRGPSGDWIGYDARPSAVKTALAYTLQRLGVDHIDVYRPARLDPNVPIEDTVGAIAEMVQAGYVRHVGLSEVGSQTIRRASAVHPIADLQIEYSLISRGIEDGVLDTTRELGIAITAYGVLSRGLISGNWTPGGRGQGDFRAMSPRFQAGNVERNLALVEGLRRIAEARGVTVAQLAIAWVLQRGEDIIPVIGARRRDRLAEALGALDITLTPDDVAAIEQAVPKGSGAGDRYAAHAMASLDSERG